ncbi:hypothetical protein ES288_A10G065200v1 [Gossypium darwinii]|nr:hypothetical protein ES288_A10G065200v1 [Gossypium darwinii]
MESPGSSGYLIVDANGGLNQQRSAAKKLASQYQKEADKCNSGMETCEEVREKAEEALSAQMKLTAMWEIRARQKGWREKVAKSNAFPYFI